MRSAGGNFVIQRAIFIVRCILAVILWHEFPTSELKSLWRLLIYIEAIYPLKYPTFCLNEILHYISEGSDAPDVSIEYLLYCLERSNYRK